MGAWSHLPLLVLCGTQQTPSEGLSPGPRYALSVWCRGKQEATALPVRGKTKTVPVMTKNDAFFVHGLDSCLCQHQGLTPTSESEEGSVTEAKEEERRGREGKEREGGERREEEKPTCFCDCFPSAVPCGPDL